MFTHYKTIPIENRTYTKSVTWNGGNRTSFFFFLYDVVVQIDFGDLFIFFSLNFWPENRVSCRKNVEFTRFTAGQRVFGSTFVAVRVEKQDEKITTKTRNSDFVSRIENILSRLLLSFTTRPAPNRTGIWDPGSVRVTARIAQRQAGPPAAALSARVSRQKPRTAALFRSTEVRAARRRRRTGVRVAFVGSGGDRRRRALARVRAQRRSGQVVQEVEVGHGFALLVAEPHEKVAAANDGLSQGRGATAEHTETVADGGRCKTQRQIAILVDGTSAGQRSGAVSERRERDRGNDEKNTIVCHRPFFFFFFFQPCFRREVN